MQQMGLRRGSTMRPSGSSLQWWANGMPYFAVRVMNGHTSKLAIHHHGRPVGGRAVRVAPWKTCKPGWQVHRGSITHLFTIVMKDKILQTANIARTVPTGQRRKVKLNGVAFQQRWPPPGVLVVGTNAHSHMLRHTKQANDAIRQSPVVVPCGLHGH